MFSVHRRSALAVRKQTGSIHVNSSSMGPNHLRSRVRCVNIEEEYYDARSSDIGEKGTHRIIAEMLWDRHERDASLPLNVLDHEDTLDFLASETYFDANEHETKRMEPDYEKVQACLGFAPIEVIKKTFVKTTQYARNIVCLPFRTHLKSRFPALNVRRRNEPVVTGTVWALSLIHI